MAKKAVAKPLALLVRPNRDVFNAKMPGVDDHLNQRAQLSAFFVKVNDMLPNCLMVIGGHWERFTPDNRNPFGIRCPGQFKDQCIGWFSASQGHNMLPLGCCGSTMLYESDVLLRS
jgi:hypothetical protein